MSESIKAKMILSAIFGFRNIAVLAAFLGAGFLLRPEWIPYQQLSVPAAGLVAYMALVVQSLTSKQFQEEFKRKWKIRQLRSMNHTCLRLASEVKKKLMPAHLQKLRKVMNDRSDIVNTFLKEERNYLKEKIVEQTLQLVISYIRLLTNYDARSKELNSTDMGVIANRISLNTRKLGFTKDIHAQEDIRKLIEMDEKMIERVKLEKNELDRISAKLEYMEGSVNMFKHQILSGVELEGVWEKLDTVVHEAEALDSVLTERRKNREKN